ncbi:MAG: hypothetical protein ACK50I_10925, partial [Burkholderiales bacterium]
MPRVARTRPWTRVLALRDTPDDALGRIAQGAGDTGDGADAITAVLAALTMNVGMHGPQETLWSHSGPLSPSQRGGMLDHPRLGGAPGAPRPAPRGHRSPAARAPPTPARGRAAPA